MIVKFPNSKTVLAFVAKVAAVVFFIGVISYLAVKSPDWHADYLFNKVGKVVIKVVKDKKAISGGTGFHVIAPSGKTYIMTNKHVCGVRTEINFVWVSFPDKKRFVKRRIIDVSEKHDLCLIEALHNKEGIQIADSFTLGQRVRAIGHPGLRSLRASLGRYLAKVDIDIIVGMMVSQEDCDAVGGHLRGLFSVCVKSYEAVETNIVIFPGSSGSPAVNFTGDLVGVVFAGHRKTNYGYLVPLKYIKDFMEIY
jgi:S1-C subfamily serine protease